MKYDVLVINGAIDQRLIKYVLDIDAKRASERLIIIIQSNGGDPFVAYRVMQHLHYMYTGSIDIVVPNQAMSAATLMSLGGNKIYMHEGSCLGPLDIQVAHPSDGSYISTIDIRQSTYNILSQTENFALRLFQQAKNDMGLPRVEAAKIAHKTAMELVQPMVRRIDPFHLNESARSADFSKKYAYYLLVNRMLSDDTTTANQAAEILASKYDMHEYAIVKEEAVGRLHLKVSDITELDVLPELSYVLNNLPSGNTYIRMNKAKEE